MIFASYFDIEVIDILRDIVPKNRATCDTDRREICWDNVGRIGGAYIKIWPAKDLGATLLFIRKSLQILAKPLYFSWKQFQLFQSLLFSVSFTKKSTLFD